MNKDKKFFKKNKSFCREENIISLKVYDQCRQQDCFTRGPVISTEENECIILPPEHFGNDFGSVILPKKAICLPEWVSKVKIINNSFKIKKIIIEELVPSQVKKGHWDIQIKYLFTFKIQLFDINMNILKVLCYPTNDHESECIKDSIDCIISYTKNVRLYGSDAEAPVIYSDIFTPQSSLTDNSPHVLVEAKADPIDISIVKSDESCDCDDIYFEPTFVIFVTIGLITVIRLFRLVSLLIDSKGIEIPELCSIDDDPCDLFDDIDFPDEMFNPKQSS